MHGKQLRQNSFDFRTGFSNKCLSFDKKLQESINGKDLESYFRGSRTEEELLSFWLKEAKMRAKQFVDDERKKGRAWIESGPRGRRGRARKKDTASSSVHLENVNAGKRTGSKAYGKPEIGDKTTSDDKTQQVDRQTIEQDAYRDYTVGQPPPVVLLSQPNSGQSHLTEQTEQYGQVNDLYEFNLNDPDLVSKNYYSNKLDDELVTRNIVDLPPDHCNQLNDATLNEITDLIVLPGSAPSSMHHQPKVQEVFASQRSENDIDLPYYLELYDTTTLNYQFNQAASLIESSDLMGTNESIRA